MTKTNLAIELVLFYGFSAIAGGQTAPTVNQTASQSPCANIVALSGAKVDCSNLTPAQKKALESIPAILKATLEDRSYFEAIMKKLNEMSQNTAPPTVINSAPGGFAVSGGILTSPTVNNFGPPARRLDPSTREATKSCLTLHPGTIEIMALADSKEAHDYAGQWLDFFSASGWTIQDNNIHPFMIGGGIWTGTQIHIRGSYGPTGKDPKYDSSTPGGALVGCLVDKSMPDPTNVVLDEKVTSDYVSFQVGPHP
jgi:hypothetical protein